ncbi:hypothetical protein BU23DRAFT_553215 [Bimuria novae-zelandiae CBS 107.79]|uniref:Uncharacterized protein n=1 Tax=Bimuria novae-zelandiae CBS 107.79 TaxID=1447943 RepID=A0A6A5VHM3_9PLEO|nr:hypothetical protein BU23DRAFT_553215 [Bimuria novae-zelandiae CBS 107.79]
MDSHAPRRPPRALPSSTAPPPRRLFQTTHAPPGPRAPSRATTASKPSTVHIPPDASTNPDADLVERDSQGNYKIIAAPAAMRLAIEKPMTAEEEEREQERQVIALYGRSGAWSDQAAVQEEIEGALKSSMSRMIASLETDKWMFEGEGGRKN